jgi:hypothetical protein
LRDPSSVGRHQFMNPPVLNVQKANPGGSQELIEHAADDEIDAERASIDL